jgi:hypothetical protein
MVAAIFLSCLAWATLVLFFLLLARISAKPVPTPPSIESKKRWAYQLTTSKTIFTGAHLSS